MVGKGPCGTCNLTQRQPFQEARMKTFELSCSNGVGSPDVAGFFDPRTFSIQYVVSDPATGKCAIIDPVHDFDEKSGATATHHADELLAYVAEKGLEVEWVLDTHPHADHFSAARYLKERTGAPTAIGEKVVEVQKLWKKIYHCRTCRPTAPSGIASSPRATPSASASWRRG